MKLDTALGPCLIEGTSFKESGKRVAIERKADEFIIAIRTDHESARKVLGIKRASDVLFFYLKHQRRPVLVFVELKGKDIAHALDQLLETTQAVAKAAKVVFNSTYPQPSDIRALIVRSGSAPNNQTELQEDFYKRSKGISVKFARDHADLRQFL